LFDEAVSFNMAPSNLRRYEEWYQFRDPMTFELRARRRATLVDEVIPRGKLVRTEFYNDFLARDGLHHGVNMFIFDGDRDLGDFRIWRAKAVRNFVRAISICSMRSSRICGARCCAAAAAAH
jgi:hypothetical protein